MTQQQYYYGTGRRKTSVARVRVYNTPGGVTINGKPLEEAIPQQAWAMMAVAPLTVTKLANDVTVTVKAHGGGVGSQTVFDADVLVELLPSEPRTGAGMPLVKR